MLIRDSDSQSGRFDPRVLLAFSLCSSGAFLALLSFAASAPRVTDFYAKPPRGPDLAPINFAPSAVEQQVHGLSRGMPVTYVVRNGKAIFQGDIILDDSAIDSVSVA